MPSIVQIAILTSYVEHTKVSIQNLGDVADLQWDALYKCTEDNNFQINTGKLH